MSANTPSNNRIKASHATEIDVQRCHLLIYHLSQRLDDLEAIAGRLGADYGHAGDASHIKEKLLDLVVCFESDSDETEARDALMASIDAELGS